MKKHRKHRNTATGSWMPVFDRNGDLRMVFIPNK
jgi:hypothetical protein